MPSCSVIEGRDHSAVPIHGLDQELSLADSEILSFENLDVVACSGNPRFGNAIQGSGIEAVLPFAGPLGVVSAGTGLGGDSTPAACNLGDPVLGNRLRCFEDQFLEQALFELAIPAPRC